MKVCVNYGRAAAHNDKAEKMHTGSANSLENVKWPVEYKSKKSKTNEILDDADSAGLDRGLLKINTSL